MRVYFFEEEEEEEEEGEEGEGEGEGEEEWPLKFGIFITLMDK